MDVITELQVEGWDIAAQKVCDRAHELHKVANDIAVSYSAVADEMVKNAQIALGVAMSAQIDAAQIDAARLTSAGSLEILEESQAEANKLWNEAKVAGKTAAMTRMQCKLTWTCYQSAQATVDSICHIRTLSKIMEEYGQINNN